MSDFNKIVHDGTMPLATDFKRVKLGFGLKYNTEKSKSVANRGLFQFKQNGFYSKSYTMMLDERLLSYLNICQEHVV